MRVLYFGTYSVGAGYPRNTVLIESLRSVGVEVHECHVPLFGGPSQKIAAATTLRGALWYGLRAATAWLRLGARFFTAGPRDVVVVGYTGHLDLFLARTLSTFTRRPLVLDAFLSPYDTIVGDRALLHPHSRTARALFHFERASLHLADRVLTDTQAGADFLARTFGLPLSRCVAVPVGSLVRGPVLTRRRTPVAARVSSGGDVLTLPPPAPFRVLFAGSFVPLQGLPYILDAAAAAPEIDFRIVGDGPDGTQVEQEVRERGLSNVDLVRRFMTRTELEGFMTEADAVLGVFGTAPKTARVIPCKVYDGLAAGRAVVTGDTPAARELLTDGEDALLVDRSDPGSLAAALRRLRDEPGLRDRLRRNARRLAHRSFSPEAIGMLLRGALQELVQP